jgi:Zn-dependent peptidase ImmA (M78 family)
MANSIAFNLSPTVLEWARNSMGYTIEEAAKKAGVPSDRYEAWETGKKLPTYKQLEGLAEKVYKRSVAILMLSKPPQENPIQNDFRSLSNAQVSDLSPETRLALRKAKRYQLILAEVTPGDSPARFTEFKVTVNDDPKQAAARFREFIDLSLAEQKSWKPDDAYNNFQKKVESLGIYVFKLPLPMPEVRAFCLTGSFPVVVLNKDDSKNGRIFSLFHELCHILFNENDVFKDSSSGNLTKGYAETERFCNQFAASFLVPDDSFMEDIGKNNLTKNKIRDQDIQRFSSSYNVSNEVIARKFLLLDLITEDFFWSRKRAWDAAARALKEKQNEALKDNDGGMNQGIKIIYEKGRPYVAGVVNAYHQGLISSSDLSNYLETKLSNLPKINERLNH